METSPMNSHFNLARHVLARGMERPDKTALILAGAARVERISYGRLIAAVRGTARGLLETGLIPGVRPRDDAGVLCTPVVPVEDRPPVRRGAPWF